MLPLDADPPRYTSNFPIPVVGLPLGPGSQTEDETLDYITMPRGMDTYQPPSLPEPEDFARADSARTVLHQIAQALKQQASRGADAATIRIALTEVPAAELALINQILGEGEVSAQVLDHPQAAPPSRWQAADATLGAGQAQIQESVFAGVWRVLEQTEQGWVDAIEVGRVPACLLRAAAQDAQGVDAAAISAQSAPATSSTKEAKTPPLSVMNAPSILVELADQRARWQSERSRPGAAASDAHVVNLSLLPVTPDDIGWIDHQLGTGRVLILSRGYGNCRITNCCVPHSWRVVYYNSQDAVILNTIEVTDIPAVACAAPEDLADSAERLAEVLAWVEQG